MADQKFLHHTEITQSFAHTNSIWPFPQSDRLKFLQGHWAENHIFPALYMPVSVLGGRREHTSGLRADSL